MEYTKDVIFSTVEDATLYYEQLGFNVTEDHRIVMSRIMQVEVTLHKIGPQMLRSHVTVRELDKF